MSHADPDSRPSKAPGGHDATSRGRLHWMSVLIGLFLMLPNGCHAFVLPHLSSPSGYQQNPSSSSSSSSTTLFADGRKSAVDCPVVVVKRSYHSMEFRNGNPLIFPTAIAYTIPSDLNTAEWVQIQVTEKEKSNPSQAKTTLLGWGVYNPNSRYRVRILTHTLIHPEWSQHLKLHTSSLASMSFVLDKRFRVALSIRSNALGLPDNKTDTYRMVNGEGDGLSGLAIDIMGGQVAVVMSSAAWCQIYKNEIQQALHRVLLSTASTRDKEWDIVWKTTPSRLQQDGYNNDQHDTTSTTLPTSHQDGPVLVKELGITYQTFPFDDGQKTGFYCDQRENRWNLAQLCQGKRVLDLCCYHGGFTLNAMINGKAQYCMGVDSSRPAIDACKTNAQLNGLVDDNVVFVQDDITNFMKEFRNNHGDDDGFDVVVLDPPKLAPTTSGLDKASRKYASLNRDALKLVSRSNGGLFLTCTCSAAMTQKDGGQYFLKMVQKAAMSAKRVVTLLRVSGAASCHTQSPASYPAGNYLTAALFHVAPNS